MNPTLFRSIIAYLRNQIFPLKPVQLILQTLINWQQDDCLEMGAALAYYALFSLFPICLVMLSIVGFILGPQSNGYEQLLLLAKNALPQESYQMVKETLLNLHQSSLGAGLVGFGLLLITASKIFEALTRSVNKIWKVTGKPGMTPEKRGVKQQVFKLIRDKILAFLLVLSSVLILLLSMLSQLALRIILAILNHFNHLISWLEIDTLALINSLQFSLSYGIILVVVMALFKSLPSRAIAWRDIWLGSLVTTSLFLLLQNVVSNGVVQIGGNFQAYGVIGNVMVLMLWNFLLFQIFFLGCELNYVYTFLWGSHRHHRQHLIKVQTLSTNSEHRVDESD